MEEVEVYKALGEHEHIVTHYGATFKGSDGRANIFMEKCGKLLKTIYDLYLCNLKCQYSKQGFVVFVFLCVKSFYMKTNLDSAAFLP